MSKLKRRKIIAVIAPIALFAILAWGSVHLKVKGLVGDTALVSLLGLSGFFAFILYFQDRIKKLALTGVELRKAVQEVKDAESAVRELSLAVLDVVEASSHGIMLETFDGNAYNRAVERVRRMSKPAAE